MEETCRSASSAGISRKCGRLGVSSRSPVLRARARTRRMQATVGRPWLGRACGLELIEPSLSLPPSLAFSSNAYKGSQRSVRSFRRSFFPFPRDNFEIRVKLNSRWIGIKPRYIRSPRGLIRSWGTIHLREGGRVSRTRLKPFFPFSVQAHCRWAKHRFIIALRHTLLLPSLSQPVPAS